MSNVEIREIRSSAMKSSDPETYIAHLSRNPRFGSTLSLYISFYAATNDANSLGALVKQVQQYSSTHAELSGLRGLNDPDQILRVAVRDSVSTCIESGDESALLELIEKLAPGISATQMVEMARKGMLNGIAEITGRKLAVLTDSNAVTIKKLFFCEDDFWTLSDAVKLLVKSDFLDERIFAMISQCDVPDEDSVVVLLKYGREKLAKCVVDRWYEGGKRLEDSTKILAAAFARERMSFAMHFEKQLDGELNGDVGSLFGRLLEGMRRQFSYWGYYIYFLKKYVKYMPQHIAKELVDYIDNSLDPVPDSFVLNSLNPLKTCICLYELLAVMRDRFSTISLHCSAVCQSLVRTVGAIVGEINEEEQVSAMYKDRDFEGRDVIELGCELELTEVFSNKYAEKLAAEVWQGSNEELGYFFESSSLWELLRHTKVGAERDYERETRWSHYYRNVRTFKKQSCQYYYWRNGVCFRYIIEAMLAFTQAVLVYVLIQSCLNPIKKTSEIYRECYAANSCTMDTSLEVEPYVEQFLNYAYRIVIIVILSVFLIVDDLMKTGYTLLRGTRPFFNKPLIFIDLCISGLGIFYWHKYLSYITNLYFSGMSDQERVLIVVRNADPLMPILLGIYLFLVCVRALFFFTVSSYIGPFVMSLEMMIAGMGQFALIYIIFLLVFALMFTFLNLLYLQDGFDGIIESFFSLFQSALGVFDLNVYNGLENDIVLKVSYLVFIIIFSILLLNMLVAILTQIYENHNNNATALYLKQIFEIREVYAPDDSCDFLTHSFFPLSIMFGAVGLAISLFLGAKARVRLNTVLLMLEYTVAFAISLCFFVAVELVLLPAAYLKCVVHKVALVFRGGVGCFWRLAVFVISGPVILAGNVASDVVYYARHCYSTEQGEVRPSAFACKTDIPAEIYSRIIVWLKEKGDSCLEFQQIRRDLRDILGINRSLILTQRDNRSNELGKAFMFSGLLNFFRSLACEYTEGRLEVRIPQALSILQENFFLSKREERNKAQPAPTTLTTCEKPVSTVEANEFADNSNYNNTMMPIKGKASATTAKRRRKVSMQLLKWYNPNNWEKALLSLKNPNDAIISELRKISQKLNLIAERQNASNHNQTDIC